MSNLLQNAKSWQTSLVGVLALIAMLPQNEVVQQVMAISPSAAKYIGGAAGVAAGLTLIFGVKSQPKVQ